MTRSANIVVLGAGMVGVGAALALQARGRDVLLIDRSGAGNETSYGNAGVIQGEAHEPYALPRDIATLLAIACKRDNAVDWDWPGLWRAAPSLLSYWRNSAPARHRSISQAYSRLVQRATGDHAPLIAASQASVRRDGYRLIFRDAESFDLMAAKAVQSREAYGLDFTIEDGAALATAEPALKRRLAGAIHWRDAWTSDDPGGLVKAYAALYRQRGGTLVDASISALTPQGHGWLVRSDTGTFEAEHVVIALGAWSPELLAPLGYRVPMIRKRGYHMHFDYPETGARPSVPWIDATASAVYAPMRAGLRIATGADLSIGRGTGMPKQLRCAHAMASELLDLGDAVETTPWSGVRPCMPDMLPVVGAAPRHEGLWFDFGHGHQGFTLGPTTGALLAGVMSDDADPVALPLSPSRPSLGLVRG